MRKRFLKAAAISILVGLATAFLFAIPLLDQTFTDENEKRLSASLALVTGYSLPLDQDNPYQAVAVKASKHIKKTKQDLRITLIATDGKVLGDSKVKPAEMVNHATRPEVIDAIKTGRGHNIRKSSSTGQKEMYQAVLETLPDGTRIIYRASLTLDGVQNARRVLWSCAIIGIFAGLVAALFAAHYSANRVLRPLQQLTQAARRIGEGTDTIIYVENGPDEIGELSGAFNHMFERLNEAHHALEQSNERLAGILQGMDDGVVSTDAKGNIELMTRRAQEMLGKIPANASSLSECGANYLMIKEILDQVTESGQPSRKAIVFTGASERIIQVYAACVNTSENSSGALAVLSDITRIRKLEEMRSEFVANVTHELKTPLTSIRGYIELLRNVNRDEETTQSFYDIIEIEADRLQKLTDDLLQLSKIENGAREDEQDTDASVLEISNTIAETLRPEAAALGVTINVLVPSELFVKANPRRLHQLLKNLMENAVKYNKENGIVEVTGGIERGVAVIRVRDTGIGIPDAHTNRVFERFYRVDKGRSREQGGTGLGLSIVKHIVSLYGGDVRVDSSPEEGSTFTVRLPLSN